MLKLIVDFATLLIGPDTRDSSKMLTHLLRVVIVLGSLFNVLREKRVKGDPAGT